jgi:hypothetical protein
MSRFVLFLLGLGILLGSEFFHGQWTNRWKLSGEPEASCARLPKQEEPMIVGDWRGRPGAPLQDEDLVLGEIAGYFFQEFTNPRGQRVYVLVVCGRPGPIAVHTPEVCLNGEGYAVQGEKQRLEIPLAAPYKPVGFWVGQFYRTDGGLRRDRRQFWSYGANGTWTADDNPRFNFARYPALYKIYIMRPLPRKDDKLEDDPTLEFIKVFMPELQKRLFGTASEGRKDSAEKGSGPFLASTWWASTTHRGGQKGS